VIQNIFSREVFVTPEQKSIHTRALELSSNYKKLEAELIEVLQQVEATKLFKQLGCSSLFKYAVEILGFSESVAYLFISVARKARDVAALAAAIREGTLSVSKAGRLVAVLNPENGDELISFAQQHTSREIDREVARRNPKPGFADRVKVLSAELLALNLAVSAEFFRKLKRAESVQAQKGKLGGGFAGVLELALDEYLHRHDPVVKAERAAAKNDRTKEASPEELCLVRVPTRKPLTAAQRHEVFRRDGGRCTYHNESGKRCDSDRWVDIHHIHPVSQGGGNDPQNLTTLCSFHHDLVHQLSLPLEGGVSWLRSPVVGYGMAD